MTMPMFKQFAASVAASALLAGAAFADTTTYTADLTTGAEVPPTEGSASGTAEVTVDTDANQVSWTVTYTDLTGDPIAAHIHGPASETENAPPVIDMSESINEGSADITKEQIDDLENGKYYVNVHTEKYPDGEIRGQLAKKE
ncbi:MAG: CHRD domain-containing protein [Rhodobacterales bacterium]|nr:CHRD domain-containing protein [Rhodobacterales bacterium]